MSNESIQAPPVVKRVVLSTDEAGEIHVTLEISPGTPRVVEAIFTETNDRETAWCASVPCSLQPGGTWGHHFSNGPIVHERVLELSQVRTPDGMELDPPAERVLVEPIEGGEWITGAVAEDERARLVTEREEFFTAPVVVPGTDTSKASEFASVMVADKVHLTLVNRLPGIAVIPLQQSTIGSDLGQVLNDLLPQLGYAIQLNPDAIMDLARRQSHVATIHVPRIIAETPEAAGEYVHDLAQNLLNLIALRRQDRATLLGGVLISIDKKGAIESVIPWIDGPGYTGNLLGGMFSGEDPRSLLGQWEGQLSRPQAQLWLSLYADALAESRPDYRFFRLFNLLEGIASEVVDPSAPVHDRDGSTHLRGDGKPYTFVEARAKVFLLIQTMELVAQHAPGSTATAIWTPAQEEGDIWEELDLWVKVRNEVAHRGTWRLPPGAQPDKKRQVLETRIARHAYNGKIDDGFAALIRTVRGAAEMALHLALAGRWQRLGASDSTR